MNINIHRTPKTKRLFLSLLFLIPLSAYSTQNLEIHIRGPQSVGDASYEYYVGLIHLAIEKSPKKDKGLNITIKQAPYMVQGRALKYLQLNRKIDVYWAGTSIEREEELRAIRIPLTKGLLGFRMPLLHEKNVTIFDFINNKSDLVKLRPCQGTHWPDTDILLANGFVVITNPIYENMFSQVYTGRCDFFPRGVNEAYSEYLSRKGNMPALTLYTDLIIHYPFPMYFFLNKENEKLAEILESGLEAAISDGSFDNYLKNHSTTKHLFPLSKWINTRYIKLDNPFLPDDTPTQNPRYWIIPPKTEDKNARAPLINADFAQRSLETLRY